MGDAVGEKRKMKAAIVNPYLDTLGGGERYTMSFAKVLAEKGYRIDVQWRDASIKERIEERFGMDLEGFRFVKDVSRGDGYDALFWVSDGSIPTLKARKNFLHFQVPFQGVSGKSLINRMKFFRINRVICNSYFTKSFIDKEYGVDSKVIYPPVDVHEIKPKRKRNVILFVGRFSQLKQAKNQDILVKAFKKLDYKKWKLVLAGGTEVGVGDYLDKLKKLAKGENIEIIESPSFDQIKKLYGQAKIFWSAVGYGIDEKKEPERVEHFGITLVEAMAAGCVPIVFSAGGYREIVSDKENGFLWKNIRSLRSRTEKLVADRELLVNISEKAERDAKVYEYERFKAEVSALF